MLILLSPAKRLDFESRPRGRSFTEPEFLDDAEVLVKSMRRLSAKKIGALMGVSEEIAEENHRRFAAWSRPISEEDDARPAIHAFKGDVYLGLDTPSLDVRSLKWAQSHVRILSGLYGVLRPLDLMLAYRLEMGLPVKVGRRANLYAYWKDKLAPSIDEALTGSGSRVLLNLASNEYFKAVDTKAIEAPVVTAVFKEKRDDGRLQVISFLAKRARGLMARFVIDERVNDPEGSETFGPSAYRFNAKESSEGKLVFTRKFVPVK